MEDFVSYDIAVKLKEKGFNVGCHAYYEPLKHCLNLSRVLQTNSFAENYNCITAPTISQVLKWLRDEKSLHVEVVSAAYGYIYIISDTPNKGGTDRVYSKYRGSNDGGAWDDYNECIFDAIEYVIDNLIQYDD